jgi:uncharacterized phage protein (TIGR02216 family)
LRAAAPPAVEDTGAAAFPWDEAMGFAFSVLRIAPRDFWAMTPRELAAALKPFAGAAVAPPSRAGLEELMTRFPDETRR